MLHNFCIFIKPVPLEPVPKGNLAKAWCIKLKNGTEFTRNMNYSLSKIRER